MRYVSQCAALQLQGNSKVADKKLVKLALTEKQAEFLERTLAMLSDPNDIDFDMYNAIHDALFKEMEKKGIK